MGSFLRHAEEIFATANGAAAEDCHLAILLGADGAIHMLDPSGWELESLRRHHGAAEVFRVVRENGRVRMEASTAGTSCTMRAESPAAILRPALPEYPVTMRTWPLLPAPTPPTC